ncbi:hypothetical protein [Actinoplanes sp. G11-F43]|uniref:hypothetical protein n=1 Tax=Actinoplanes sp. G11-F43 TaxID=3424130 RepID=UPI003D325EDB
MISRWLRASALLTVTALAGCVTLGGPGEQALDDPCPVPSGPPTAPHRIAIDHDDHRAEHVGHTADGRQFFLTRPFQPDGTEYVALYLFTAGGTFDEALIDPYDKKVFGSRLAGLGPVTYGRISVEPFAVDRFGTTFGLISTPPEAAGDLWWVTAEPGDYMAFTAPWDCGDYDT